MNEETIYKNLIAEWDLTDVADEDKDEILSEIAKTVYTQFLIDVFNICGEEKFKAIESSFDMGEEFYNTTLKHILPNYDEVFQKAKAKVLKTYKNLEEKK